MGQKFVVNGGRPLKGEVYIDGCKNAAVGILPAAILAEGVCVIDNVPNVSDIRILISVLENLGVKFERNGSQLKVDATNVNSSEALDEKVSKMRGSSYLIGALLGRTGKAIVASPGGCNFGTRPIDQHIKGFKALGADVVCEYGSTKAVAENGLHAANIYLDVVSVGATINIMIAASKAEGLTIIENCAMEPHVVDVANFLNMCGANIRGAGTNTIKIKGVPHLHGCEYIVIPDQIEAGTFMVAAAATKGDVIVRNVIPKHQDALTAKLQEMNVGIEEGSDFIHVFYKGDLTPTNVKTVPYPGFPTDMQPQIVTALSQANGESTVTETIFNSRFAYVADLNRMGAEVNISDKSAVVKGGKKLRGISVRCPDLRAGAAFVIAGLVAEGTTTIYDIHYIDRGYYNFEQKLTALGADIKREEVTEEERW